MITEMPTSAGEILKIIRQCKLPISQQEIKKKLYDKGQLFDRSTIYRGITYLKTQGQIKEIDFGDGKTRYEKIGHHHHHVVCKKCKKVFNINLPTLVERALQKIERGWVKENSFLKIDHSLEFFGTCKKCNTPKKV